MKYLVCVWIDGCPQVYGFESILGVSTFVRRVNDLGLSYTTTCGDKADELLAIQDIAVDDKAA